MVLKKVTVVPTASPEGVESPSRGYGYEVFDRAAILKSIGVRSDFSNFEELVETTQKVIS